MSGNSLPAGKLKVTSLTLVLPKAQKVFWTVIPVGQQNSPITVTQDVQVKQTTQIWTSLSYVFAIGPDATSIPELEFLLATKQSSIEKRKDLLASTIIDLNEAVTPQIEPFSFALDLGLGYHVSLVFNLHSPSILRTSILLDDLQVVLCALEDVKSLFSKPELASRLHEFLATQDVMNALIESTQARIEHSDEESAPMEPFLIEIWHKVFEVSVFTRAGSQIHGIPAKIISLIGTTPENMFQGNLVLKTSLLDALKQITAIQHGIALMPQFCHLLQISIQQASPKSDGKDNTATEMPSIPIQRLIGTLIRILISFDPKYISWIAREGNILGPLKELLLNWKRFDSQLLKQVNQLLMFFGASSASLLDELQLQPILGAISEQSEEIPLQLSCQKALSLIWFKPETVILPESMVSNLYSSNAVERIPFFEALSNSVNSTRSSKDKLVILLNFLAPKESEKLEFLDSDIDHITQICFTVQPSYQDLLDTDFFKIFSALLKLPSYPASILTRLMDYWRNARPSAESFDPPTIRLGSGSWNLRSPDCILESSSQFADGWEYSEKIDHYAGLSEEENRRMTQEQSLLLDSSFFSALQSHLRARSFNKYLLFYLSILWHQPALLHAVQASTGNQFLNSFREAIIKKKKKRSSEVLMLLVLLAMEFEAVTDNAYEVIKRSNPARKSEFSEINFEAWSQIIDHFREILAEVEKEPKPSYPYFLGIDKVLIKLVQAIFQEIQEVSVLLDFEKLEEAKEGDPEYQIHRHWLGLCSLFESLVSRLGGICSSYRMSLAAILKIMTLMSQTNLNGFFLPVIRSLITAGASISDYVVTEGDSDGTCLISEFSSLVSLETILKALVFHKHEENDDGSLAAGILKLVSSMLVHLTPDSKNGPKLPFDQLLNFTQFIRVCESDPTLISYVEQIYSFILLHAPQRDENGEAIFYSPESIEYLVRFGVSRIKHTKNKWIYASRAYEALFLFIRWWPQMRHIIFCQAIPLTQAAKRFKKDFRHVQSKIQGLSPGELAKGWDNITRIVELYYIPHMLSIERTEYGSVVAAVHKKIGQYSLYLGKTKFAVHYCLLTEMTLDIHLMLPHSNITSLDFGQVKLLVDLRMPSEHLIRKTLYLLRRTAFVETTWPNFWRSIYGPDEHWMFESWYRLLKYPTCVTMLCKVIRSTGLDMTIRKVNKSQPQFCPTSHMHTSQLNMVHGIVAQLQQMEEDPTRYFLSQQYQMQIYAPITAQITREGLEVDDVEKPMFKVVAGQAAAPRENPRERLLPPSVFANTLWNPSPRFSYDFALDFGSWVAKGYDGPDSAEGYLRPLPQYPKPLFFDEYPIFNQLPDADRSLSARDLIFSRQFEAGLRDDGLSEILDEEKLEDARIQLSQSGFLGNFVPSVIYQNHLKTWFDSAVTTSDEEFRPTGDNSISSELEVERLPQQVTRGSQEAATSSFGDAPSLLSDSSSSIDTEKLAILHMNARQQLIEALEGMLDLLYLALDFPKYGLKFLALKDKDNVFRPPFTLPLQFEMRPHAFFSFIGLCAPSSKSSKFDIYSSKRLKFKSWIPVTTYWKWLGCMARISWILPERAQVFCGKLITHLMRLDIEQGESSASEIGAPMYNAIAVFGNMTCNPNINPLAPRLIKIDANDPLDGLESLNDERRKDHAEPEVRAPSTHMFFEDVQNVPSYIAKYLPMLLDEIELKSSVCTRREQNQSCCTNHRRLWDILVLLTRAHSSSCFQLIEFGLDQLRRDLQSQNAGHRPGYHQIAQLMSILVRNKGDFERMNQSQSSPVQGSEPKTAKDLFEMAFGSDLPDRTEEKLALAVLLRHLDCAVLQSSFHPVVMKFITRLVSSTRATKFQTNLISILPFLQIGDISRIFLSAPSVFVTTICGHPGLSPVKASEYSKSLLVMSHEYQFELRQAIIHFYLLYDSKSTFLCELLGLDSTKALGLVLPPLDYSFASNLEECQAHLIFVCGWFSSRDPVGFKKVAKSPNKVKGKSLLKQLQYPLYDAFEAGVLKILPLVLELLVEGDQLLQSSLVKANGPLWAIPSLSQLPDRLVKTIQPQIHNFGPQYGVSVVDRVVTVWFEDRGVTLPSSNSAWKQSKKDQSANLAQPYSSVISFQVLPAATTNPIPSVQVLSHCRFGYASLQAISALKDNGLQGIGEVPESWSISNDQGQIWSEGSCLHFSLNNAERDTFSFNPNKPISLSYHQYLNEISIENLASEPPYISSTRVSIPLPSNRKNLTIYPCISFYHPRRFFVIPGCHPDMQN